MADYNFQYLPVTGKLAGKDMLDQTERAINELAEIVNEGSAQVEIITTLANDANNNAAEALEKADEALETSSRVYITESSAVDLDDYCESQLIYIADDTSDNLPVEDTGFLEVKTNDDKTACDQVFVCDTTADTYTRSGTITAETVGDVTTYTATFGAWSSKPATENYVQNELQSYAPSNSPALTGTATAENITASGDVGVGGDLTVTGAITGNLTGTATNATNDGNGNQISTTYLPLAGGTLTGVVDGVTATASDSSTKLATTAYVKENVPKSVGGTQRPVYTDANGKITACTTTGSNGGLEGVNTIASNYIRYVSGLQICWGSGTYTTTGSSVTFPAAFNATPNILVSAAGYSNSGGFYDATSTKFTCKTNRENGAAIAWRAIGKWK